MNSRIFLTATLASVAVASTATAQTPANDNCANATVAMTGLNPFDSTGATDDGITLDPLVCTLGFSNDDIFQDVWFTYTPTTTDSYDIEVLNTGGAWDSRLAIYNQSTCPDDPALVIGCDDDGGEGLLSLMTSIPLTAGTTYLIRLGTFAATTVPAPTDLSIIVTPPPPPPPMNPANGNFYQAVLDPGITWDDAKTAAESMSFMGVQGHLATVTDQVENDFLFANFDDLHYHWLGGFQNPMDPMFSEPAGGWNWVTGEAWSYTNWNLNVPEPNNTGAFGDEDYLEILDNATFGETWNDVAQLEHSRGYVVEFPVGTGGGGVGICNGDGGDQMGCTACPCGNDAPQGTVGGCLNSSGGSTRIASSGSTSVSLPSGDTTDLRLTLDGAPSGAFCVMLSGAAVAPQNMANPCFGQDSGAQSVDRDGLRCAVQSTLRHGGRSANMSGEVMDPSGPSRVWGGEAQPAAGLAGQAGFIAGQVRYFQVTHREDVLAVCMRGLNTSQAIEVTFTP